MNWRFPAALTACCASLVIIVAAVALAAIGSNSGDLRKAPPRVPLLVESRAASTAALEAAPESQAHTPPSTAHSPDASIAAVFDLTGRAASSYVTPTPVVPTPASKAINEVIRNRLGQTPERPSTEPIPKSNLAALSTREAEVSTPPRSRPLPAQGVAPSPGRPPPDRRYEGVFTDAEIGRMRIALRLTPDQLRYWPPVEALLREIGAQQIVLVQAGRQAKEAFGIGISMRMYSAARPLLGVLREDQKAEVRKRARAMGFEQVASSI
jgi:hypothetical protein